MRIILGLICATCLLGQNIKVVTRLVQTHVLVLDDKGKPMRGLTQGDFTILDNGEPQRIASFAEVDGRDSAPLETLAPGLFTNNWRYLTRPGATSSTVILFDTLNTPFSDQAFARQEMIRFLRGVQPTDRIALYAMGADLRILHEFTQDASALVQAVNRIPARYDSESLNSPQSPLVTGQPEMDQWLQESFERYRATDLDVRVRMTVNTIEAIAQYIARAPGRKNLIWISGAFPLAHALSATVSGRKLANRDRRLYLDEIAKAARALNEADVAIYPVDARGLAGAAVPRAENAARPSQNRSRDLLHALGANYDTAMARQTMEILAQRTGGRLFANTNDIAGGVRKAIDESSHSYVLEYYPAHNRWDGGWRDIKVRLPKQGYQLRHRGGYYASGDQGLAPADGRKAVLDAIRSPLEAHALTVDSYVSREGSRYRVLMRVPADQVTFQRLSASMAVSVDFALVQFSADESENPQITTEGVALELDGPAYERTVRDGLVIVHHIPMLHRPDRLKIVLRDRLSGALGSLLAPLRGIPGK